jgi:hypothetical protein
MTRPAQVAVRSIALALENIAGACPDSFLARNWLNRKKFMAEYVPQMQKSGTQFEESDTIYWEIENPDKAIIIYLENEPYNKLIVEVKEPLAKIQMIEKALAERVEADKIIELEDLVE